MNYSLARGVERRGCLYPKVIITQDMREKDIELTAIVGIRGKLLAGTKQKKTPLKRGTGEQRMIKWLIKMLFCINRCGKECRHLHNNFRNGVCNYSDCPVRKERE